MTNPYLTQLFASFPSSVEAHHMSWKRALIGRFDVFHVHWPEVLIRADSTPRRVLRMTRFVLLLLRIRLQRKALVRTLHNVAPHDPPGPLLTWVLNLTDRWTTMWIVLNPDDRPPTDAPFVVAPHGHYRGWFEGLPRAEIEPGRLTYVGLVRPYKGVEELVSVFSAMPATDLHLRILGRILDADLASALRLAADADDRLTIVDRHLGDAELALEIAASELVVLPFVKATNSGSLLLALSFDRPVLVPSTPLFEEIAAEVGDRWVLTYDGRITASAITTALASGRTSPPHDRPDLAGRDWPLIGSIHAEAFATARTLSRVRRRSRASLDASRS
jgi:beta-1,4-mannosyltransferase